MEKYTIEVPKGIRYISEWPEFSQLFPKIPHIMDKQITGCGFTEWCLTNDEDVILCSPRNILLQNKTEQHPDEVYRVVSDNLDVDLEVDKDTSKKNAESTDNTDLTTFMNRLEAMSDSDRLGMMERISKEINTYITNRGNLPKKILVTYDSFRILKEVLSWKNIFDKFQVVVDEFQSIFTDSRFKANTELEFVETLQGIQKVCFLSATPMIDKYLEMIPEFANLPFFELDWESRDQGRVVQPDLTVRTTRSIYEPARRIIKEYLDGKYEKRYYVKNGETILVESLEAVFYVNSVTNICEIIKKNGLKPNQVNILCARTKKNELYIQKKLGKEWVIGKVPLRNESRKMFTFCTRTVYLGADFYSPCARSFILSDANIECLAVDISLDLPQILGRQRLMENPWKTAAEFYYRPLTENSEKELDEKEFKLRISNKLDVTEKKLKNFDVVKFKDVALNDIVNIISYLNYKNDYVGVNRKTGKPAINKLVLIAEQRAFDIQQKDYKDRFSVIDSIFDADSEESKNIIQVNRFFAEYDELKTYREKLRMLCETELSDKVRELIWSKVDDRVKSYLALGPERLKAVGYRTERINKELGIRAFSPGLLQEAIYQEFNEGDRYNAGSLKEKLKVIYENLDYDKTPKATDIKDWFEVKRAKVSGKDGFELVKKKM